MKLRKIFPFLVASVLTVGCTNSFEEMNEDPMAITEVSPDLILPDMQYNGFHMVAGDYQRATRLYAFLYCQYGANVTSDFRSGNYEFNSSWAERGMWTPYYTRMIKNMREINARLEEHPEYEDMYQIMSITTALSTIRQTDTFGDIPYFEAGKGEVQTPYDSQKDIYYDVFQALTDAVNLLKQKRSDQLQYGNEDMMYQGDVDKWIKLANSLRLRAALRLSFVDPEKAKAEGEAALRESLMTSNDDNARVTTPETSTWANPFLDNVDWDDFRASTTMVDMMLNYHGTVADPRTTLILSQTQGWVNGNSEIQYRGVPNGLPGASLSQPEYQKENNSFFWGYMWGFDWNSAGKGSAVSRPSGHLRVPWMLMNYAEVCFLKAEAAIRGWQGAGDAKANYEAGIRASLEEMRAMAPTGSYTTADDDAYITTGNVAWNDADDFETKLKKIITQKWIGIFPNADEAWAEFRRTGYPDLQPIVQSLDPSINPANNEFVKKLRYVDNELNNNNANATDPSLNGGQGDGMNVRVWWDTSRYN